MLVAVQKVVEANLVVFWFESSAGLNQFERGRWAFQYCKGISERFEYW